MEERNYAKETILWLTNYFIKNEKMPSSLLQGIVNHLGVTDNRARDIYKTLVIQKLLHLNYNRYSFSEALWDAINTNTSKQYIEEFYKPKKILQENNQNQTPKEKKDEMIFDPWVIIAIRIVMIIIGILASTVSIYFNYFRLSEYLPPIICVIISIAVVGFLTISFEAMILFYRIRIKKMGKIKRPLLPIAGIFLITWIFASMFSMSSIIAGMYNKKVATIKTNIQATFFQTYKQKLFSSYDETGTIDQDQINEYKQIYNSLYKKWILEGSPTISNKTYIEMNTIHYKLNNARNTKKSTEEKKQSLLTRENKAGITKDTSISNPNFYDWMGVNVLKISPDIVEFLMNLFPALFMDLVAPLSIAVALFLTNRKKDPETI